MTISVHNLKSKDTVWWDLFHLPLELENCDVSSLLKAVTIAYFLGLP